MNFKILILFLLLFQCGSFGQTAQTLDIVSWNVFLRPSILQDNQLGRVDSIGNYLNDSEADIIVLQEVFHRKSRKHLINYLSKIYPHHTSVGPLSLLRIPSGVIIFSKHKIIKERHISFKHAKGSDRMAKKGGVLATIEVGAEKVQIIGTHLQAGTGEKRAKIRRKQIQRLKQLEERNNANAIFVGDFNITWNSIAFERLLSDLSCCSDTLSGTNKNTANFSDQKLYDSNGAPKWIDFILLRKSNLYEFLSTWIDQPMCKIKGEKRRVSDHNPILSTINLK